MRPFIYERATNPAACRCGGCRRQDSAHYLAGGTTLFDLMKLDVMRPQTVIDINPLGGTAHGRIELGRSGLRLGALVRMADAADHPQIREQYPVIAQSLQLAASQQIRNMASLGGNVLQRTRCPYFRDIAYAACNKRNPGSGCAAIDGFNRSHAVLGTSDKCIATYAGDFAQALIALDAAVEIAGREGNRTIPFTALHRKPGDTPGQGNDVAAGRDDRVVFGAGRAVDAPFALSEGARPRILRVCARLGGGRARSAKRHRCATRGSRSAAWRRCHGARPKRRHCFRGKPINEQNAQDRRGCRLRGAPRVTATTISRSSSASAR